MNIIAGMDEAGKGPTLGPMVIAGVSISEENLEKLKQLKVKDSKLLTPKQREAFFPQIIKLVKDYKIIIIPAKEIDDAVESENSNLNNLEMVTFAKVINYLKPDEAIVDCPSTNIKAFTEELQVFLKQKTKLRCEHKADLNFPIVSASSILAKVTRDAEIEKLKKVYGDFGSGYPADPKTKEFLKNNWKKYPELFRRSWATYKAYSEKKQKTLKEF